MSSPTTSKLTVIPGRRERFEANPFEALIALLVIVASVSFFLGPQSYLEQSAIGLTLPIAWAYAWNAGYGLSGFGIVAGLWWGSARAEGVGLVLLATASVIQTIATWDAAGARAFVALLFLAAIIGASGVRLHTILAGKRHVIVQTTFPGHEPKAPKASTWDRRRRRAR